MSATTERIDKIRAPVRGTPYGLKLGATAPRVWCSIKLDVGPDTPTPARAGLATRDFVIQNGYAPGVVVTPLWEQLDKDLIDIGVHCVFLIDMAGNIIASFDNGEASLLDVLDAQRSYLGVRSAEVESWAALALARSDIELLLAGKTVAALALTELGGEVETSAPDVGGERLELCGALDAFSDHVETERPRLRQ